jgi:putative nucleotidyltransferase with HDIG domain
MALRHDHIRRVQNRAVALAARVGVVDEAQIRAIEAGALLHDVGKIAIPEYILNKPGKLSPAEFERMKSHVRVGAEILSQVDFPYPVAPIVLHHHENWDGSGYPDGLQGNDIPVGARILAVVDCFDALTSNRPYRRALSVQETFEIIEARSGTMYDPSLVNAFREMCDQAKEETLEPAPPVVERHTDARSLPSADVVVAESDRSSDEVRLAMQLAAAVSRTDEGCPWECWRMRSANCRM